MTLPRAGIALLCAFISNPVLAQNGTGRVVSGRTRTASGRAVANVAVMVVGGPLLTRSDSVGTYVLRNVSTKAFTLRGLAIGLVPRELRLPSGLGDTVIDIVFPDPHAPPDSVRFPLSLAQRNDIWSAVLVGISGRQDDHWSRLERAVPNSGIQVPSGPRSVILVVSDSSDASSWYHELLSSGVIAGVCSTADVRECPQTGNHYFAKLGKPQAFSPDSVVVTVDFASGDVSLCKRGRAVYDDGGESFLVVWEGQAWRFAGRDETTVSLVGGVYCGM